MEFLSLSPQTDSGNEVLVKSNWKHDNVSENPKRDTQYNTEFELATSQLTSTLKYQSVEGKSLNSTADAQSTAHRKSGDIQMNETSGLTIVSGLMHD